jgi:hypothetical protein
MYQTEAKEATMPNKLLKKKTKHWEELHHALEREITTDPPKDLDAAQKACHKLEARLLKTPGGQELAVQCRQAASIPLSNEFEVSFTVMGDATQTVTVDDLSITEEQLQKLLSSGKAVTTVQEGGTVDMTKSGRRIGRVRSVDVNCTYEDFSVEDQSF